MVGLIALNTFLGKMYVIKLINSIVIIGLSIFLIPAFFIVQRESGNPDAGKEFQQMFFPVLGLVICALVGVVIFIRSVYKLRQKS